MLGEVLIFLNNPKYLEEIYVNQNKFHTKHFLERMFAGNLMAKSIFIMDSDNKDYIPKRKALSTVFYKEKLKIMTECIKELTLD